MRATLNEQGRVTIPDDLLRPASLEPGQTVDVRVQDDPISVAPSEEYPRREIRNGLPAIVSAPGTAPLDAAIVDRMIARLRGRRCEDCA